MTENHSNNCSKFITPMRNKIDVKIPKYEVIKGTAFYHVNLYKENHLIFTFKDRYKNMRKLHEQIKKNILTNTQIKRPWFPKKRLLLNTNHEVLEERRQ